MSDHAQSLQGLLDKEAIRDLIHAYCFHFDRAEPDAVLALFAQDALVDYGPDVPVMRGHAELLPMLERGLGEFFAATSHHVSNISISFDDPDRARSNCYLYAWHRYRESGEVGHLWGQYDHVFQREAAGWRIAELRLSAVATDGFHRERMHPIGRRDAGL